MLRKLLLFFRLAAFPHRYLHQAYVYKDPYHLSCLILEMLVNDRVLSVDLPDSPFAWYKAIWQIVSLSGV